MKTLKVESIYGAISDDGKALLLQVDSADDAVKLEIPGAHLVPLLTQLLHLAVEAGRAQGIAPGGRAELVTHAVEIPATGVDFGVASPTESVLIGRCGLVNMALRVPHVSLHQISKELKDLESGG